uniref:Uncharacterized protein n=1 Tax=Romanomermis culicivorax TaxID=13658 RepID=A0A915KUH6_ROMCU
MIFVAILAAALFQSVYSSASIATLKIKVTSTTTIRIGAQITLICEITPLVDLKDYVLFKDGEIIPAELLVKRHANSITISYSFTLTETKEGLYEFVITFMDDSSQRSKRQIDRNTEADSDGENKKGFEESSRFGGDGGDIDAQSLCQRCKYNKCTVRDGENCVRTYLDCNYFERPRGLTQCDPGMLFLVSDSVTKRKGSCVSAEMCKRERLLPWQKRLGF